MHIYFDKTINTNLSGTKSLAKTSFKAVPLAKYSYLGNLEKDVIIYQLEKKDLGFLENILANINKFFAKYEITDESTMEIFRASVEAAVKLFKQPKFNDKKTKILLAMHDDDPSAILLGNILKVDKNGKLHYSSRKNHAKNETELDALATWNKMIPSEGKAILCEYFHTAMDDGFKHVYVRSEIPQYSFAVEFYKRMGFEELSKSSRPMVRDNENAYLTDVFDYGDSEIIPMKATVQDILKTIYKRSKELNRKPLDHNNSITLPKLFG